MNQYFSQCIPEVTTTRLESILSASTSIGGGETIQDGASVFTESAAPSSAYATISKTVDRVDININGPCYPPLETGMSITAFASTVVLREDL